MGGALGVRLLGVHDADVVQELMPEAAVEQVERGVLHAAVVPVYRTPVFLSVLADKLVVIVWVHIAQEVPARPCPLRHGVGLALCRASAAGAGGVDPVGHLAQRGLAVVGRLVGFHLRQHQRQLALGQRHPAALRAVDKGDRLAPVALTGEYPVAQLVVDLLFAPAVLDRVLAHRGDSLLDGHPVEKARVYHYRAVVLCDEGFLRDVAAGDDLDDRQAELRCEVPVALVVTRNAHDDTGAVAHEDVVGDEHRNGRAVHGVDGVYAVKAHAGLVLVELAALEVGLAGSGFLIRFDLAPVCYAVFPLVEQRVLRGNDHVAHAEERVGTGRENRYVVADIGLEGDLGAGGAAYPVLLLDLDALNVVQIVQIVYEPVGVLRYAEHPLALLLAHDGRAAALAHALDDLFVCQHALAARAPVDGHRGLVCKAFLEHLQEYPLRPLVVLRVGRVDAAIPVKAVAEHLELTGEVLDVLLGDDRRVDVVLYREVLGRQTESVKAYREEDVVALHSLFARDDVHRRKGARMADMQTGGGGVRELDKAVELGLVAVSHRSVGLALFPAVLPFFLYCSKIISHGESTLLI